MWRMYHSADWHPTCASAAMKRKFKWAFTYYSRALQHYMSKALSHIANLSIRLSHMRQHDRSQHDTLISSSMQSSQPSYMSIYI